MAMPDVQAQQLEEYKALRAEVLALYSRRSQRLTVAGAGISALIVAGAVSSIPELGWLALTLAASAWMDDMHNFDSMLRAATYIEVYLESTLPGLNWETIRGRTDRFKRGKAPPLRRLGGLVFSNYGIFVVVCLFASALLCITHPPASTPRWVSSLIMAVFSALVLVRAVAESTRVPRMAIEWRETFSILRRDDPLLAKPIANEAAPSSLLHPSSVPEESTGPGLHHRLDSPRVAD